MDKAAELGFDIFSTGKSWGFIQTAKIAIQTVFGRIVYSRAPALGQCNFLNLCCGKNFYPGWINADFYFSKSTKLLRPRDRKPNWRIDLRYRLPCPDSVIDGVFSEHTLEHIRHADVRRLLKELHRIMKPGAPIRIAVPDLEKYVAFYNSRTGGGFNDRFLTGAEAIASLTQNWYHLSTWDSELLARELQRAGFVDIAKCEFGKGSFDEVVRDDPKHAWETLYVEARKPE